jgi:pimeloyl-ACP methyl ester carboxylesterase
LIEALELAPCHFVGLSMGGFVGLRLAARHPALVRSLTLIDTAADGEPALNRPKYRAMATITRLAGYRVLLGPIMKIMFGRAFLDDPARAAERREMEARLLALDPARIRFALEAVITRAPVTTLLREIRVPTLVVHGADDRAIRIARARALADGIAGASWVEIPRAGHTSTVEEPRAVNAAIQAFVDRLGTRSSE